MDRSFRNAIATVLFVSLAVLDLTASQARASNPWIIPPRAKFHGQTYSQWEAEWWQAMFAIPIVGGDHPFFSGGAFGDERGVLFLAGVGGGPTIDLTILSGTALFF